MHKVIFRYVLADVTRTWLVIVGVLVFLTLGLGLSRFIGDAAAGQVPVNTVLKLAALSAVENLDIVLPISVMLAILLVVGRLCRDNEMAALFAGGAGLGVIYRPFFVFSISVAVIAGGLSIYAAPRAELAMDQLGAKTATSMVQSISPGRFRTASDGDIAFYAESRAQDGSLRHVFMRVNRKTGPGRSIQNVVTAQRARIHVDRASRQITLVLDDGWRYQGQPGQADYRIVSFAEHGVQLRPPAAKFSDKINTQSTLALLHSGAPKAIAEWQIRLSVPISIVILTLLALPLGRVPPRAGRYGRVVVGILFYALYVNAVRLAGVSIENGSLPGWLGVWWVHLVVLCFAVVLVLREQGWFTRRRRAHG